MDDLFRFLMLRAAKPARKGQADNLAFSDEAKRLAGREPDVSLARIGALVRESQRFVTSPRALTLGERMLSVAEELGPPPVSGKKVRAAVEEILGRPAAAIVASNEFKDDVARLGDTMLAAKVTSTGEGIDVSGLIAARRLYNLVARSLGTDDELDWLPILYQSAPPSRPATPPSTATPDDHSGQLNQLELQLKEIDGALAHFVALRPTDLLRVLPREELPEPSRCADTPDSGGLMTAKQAGAFRLNSAAIQQVPVHVMTAVAKYGLDMNRDALPTMTLRLEQEKSALMLEKRGLLQTTVKKVVAIGKAHIEEDLGVGGEPRLPMPTGKGSVKPVGIGDLLVVKQHAIAYVGGEVAHIENVLKSEKMSRETRRLERNETTFITETERSKEEERDTQSTERFSLKRESSETIKADFEVKAGLSVDARYGPMVEVKATTDLASSTSTEASTKQSTEFSKDVVTRSVSKLTEKIREQRITKTTIEFEEKVSHGFDNTDGPGHISGVYQWVDKVMEGQVYNYGKRLMFDVVVPEPASFYIYLAQRLKAEGENIEKPKAFTLAADEINENNYLDWAKEYGASGIEPPPPLHKVIAKAWDGAPGTGGQYISKSETIAIDEGYKALTAYVGRQRTTPASEIAFFRMVLGTYTLDIEGPAYHELNMNERQGAIAVSFEGQKVRAYAVNLEVLCQRTERATQVWQQKMHAAITAAYIVKRSEYERTLAAARAASGVTISGRNPGFNAQIISGELKKSCISMVTAQFFDAFGAVNLSPAEKYPEVDIPAATTQGTYLRFFEQAFEWERMMYFFYPYFWGLKKHWLDRALLEDVDPIFGQYLRAGAARVVFPVRPGFEEAVVHFLETGGIWSGGDLPDIQSSMYFPIVEEIKESQGAPGSEVPVGKPWTFRLPTTLVKLRPDDKLPKWKKVAEQWEEDIS